MSQLCLSNQQATELMCSSWSLKTVVAHTHGVRARQGGLLTGLCSLPLLLAPLPGPPHQSLSPSGSPSMQGWVLGLGRAAAQPLTLLSFTHSLLLWAFSLGLLAKYIVHERCSYSGLLLPVPGSRSWQTHKEHRWQWLQSEPGKQTYTPCWVVWDSWCWFRGLKAWLCGSGLWVLKSLCFAWLLPQCAAFSKAGSFSCWKMQTFIPTAHVRTQNPCDGFIFHVYCWIKY